MFLPCWLNICGRRHLIFMSGCRMAGADSSEVKGVKARKKKEKRPASGPALRREGSMKGLSTRATIGITAVVIVLVLMVLASRGIRFF